ncbi:MAG: DHH family phosphoesterase, partial [Patescibacteria group bacterium]
MNPIKVFGHTTPDTDTVVSAIVYAWYLNEIQKTPAESYILGELNKETEYVLSTFNVDVPPVLEDVSDDDRVIIVDTNNPEELPGNLANATIVEIIDHHKLTGGITTQTPLSITMRPMAATASLIYTIFNPELHDMPKGIAGILCSAILSDTLAFRSPTTTNEDKVIAEELAEIAGINLQEHA